MTKEAPKPETRSDKRVLKRETAVDEIEELAALEQLPARPMAAFAGGSDEDQAGHLGDTRLQGAQRRALASRIGRTQGNLHLQRVVASLRQDDRGPTPVPPRQPAMAGREGKPQAVQRDGAAHLPSEAGRRLREHEPTPVVRRSEARSAIATKETDPSGVADSETEAAAQEVATGQSVALVPRPTMAGIIARQPAPKQAGRTPEGEIDYQVGTRVANGVQDYWSYCRTGLTKFTNHMQFSSEKEAESRLGEALGKQVAEFLFDQAVSKLGAAGPFLALGKDLVKAASAEMARAKKAGGEVQIKKYINGLLDATVEAQKKGMAQVDKSRDKIHAAYQTEAARSESAGQEFIDSLKESVDKYIKAIPNAARFQQLFTEKFAQTGKLTTYISQGGRVSGQLYLSLRVYNEDNTWEVKDIDKEWALATTAPEPDRIADSLEDALGGKKPYQSELPKLVTIKVETEIPWALNDYTDGHIYFTADPNKFEVRTNEDPTPVKKAWPHVRGQVLAVSGIGGASK